MADEPQQTLEADWQERVAYLRELAHIVADEGLSELEIEAEGFKLTLKTASPAVEASSVLVATAPPSQAGNVGARPAAIGAAPTAAPSESFVPVVSPMVGVFYRAPSPDDPHFVEIGDRVERGQTIGLIEAMKVFNEITAEVSGVVAQIAAENGQLVETGQPLLLLK